MESIKGRSGSYYTVLGVRRDASFSDIRTAYLKLAMKWHPDRCGKEPEEAKKMFQKIQEAYQVLSDAGKRAFYDTGLYDPFDDDDDEVEGFSDFVEEMINLMSSVREEEKECTMEDLQGMLTEIVHSFDSVPTYDRAQCVDSRSSSSSSSTKRSRFDDDMIC